MRTRDIRRIAEEVADELFCVGHDNEAHRLVVETLDLRNGGGWCKGAVQDIVIKHLAKALQRRPGRARKEHKMASRAGAPWTKAEEKHLRRIFPNRSTADVADELMRPVEAVKKKASRLGLKKSAKYLKSLGR